MVADVAATAGAIVVDAKVDVDTTTMKTDADTKDTVAKTKAAAVDTATNINLH